MTATLTAPLPNSAALAPPGTAVITGVGSAVPSTSYSQRELLDELCISDHRIRSVFLNSAIERRNLILPPTGADGRREPESQGVLLRKHREEGTALGTEAIEKCLAANGMTAQQVDYLCCVTSTGFLTPGLSARLMRHLEMRPDCARLDVVGMGCNAGLNALSAVSAWAQTHPGRVAVLVCIEVCSAAYVFDGTMRTSVVNSLFGDGAVAISMVAQEESSSAGPAIWKTSSHIILDELEAMRYDWDESQARFSFYLSPDIPYVIGANVEIALRRLLNGTGLSRRDIAHWLVHAGGKKVIDSFRLNVGLSRHDLRHTIGVLRDHGNLSSGSFLFSLERLQRENIVLAGDFGVLATMGPGSTIEMGLIRW